MLSKKPLTLIAVLAFCLGVIFIPALALIVGGAILIYATAITIYAHWLAWKPGSKTDDAASPDQDIYHQP